MLHNKPNFFKKLQITVIAYDTVAICFAWIVSYLSRYNLSPWMDWQSCLSTLPITIIVQNIVFIWYGVYRGIWRFTSIPDVINVTRAICYGTLSITLVLFLISRLNGVPRSVLLLYPLFLLLFLIGPRLTYRIWKDRRFNFDTHTNYKKILILGAGRAGHLLVKDMLDGGNYLPIAFLDDQSDLTGRQVRGIPIIGTLDQLVEIVSQIPIDIICIAIPSASSAQMERIISLCEQTKIPYRSLPRLRKLLDQPSVKFLREVAIDDLLGRDEVPLDKKDIKKNFSKKSLLISGGGGSIGSELCIQLASLNPTALIIIDNNEYRLYRIELELIQKFPKLNLYVYLCDIYDKPGIQGILTQHQPDVIFHAAAYKHVPLLEKQARQAVKNNVLGTQQIAEAAAQAACGTFVLISTDKAVNPTNIMGASKRVSELICQNLNRNYPKTRFIVVRFGNVLGSTGSVVPLFQTQIASGGPVTVTHPEVARYFMTISEACHLITQAAVLGKGGEIFVLDMGKSIKVTELAKQMIRLSNQGIDREIKITYTGLRPGEKLYEELFYPNESPIMTQIPKILLARSDTINWEVLKKELPKLEAIYQTEDEQEITKVLYSFVLKFHP
ncbi:nucleoside-diphosphate sugar epimerase/dehydratase [Candidatus Nitrosacidococcus sp. I8]|uniref:nucleoside-diphosphate sugar epimerase/dehydratase n=1 Tax=Candidatus Nitrosacidococcus sp. I8 TaxID=2942908 RepID=UPI002227776C|nr:nucleoside-diphosphate sugar epimerase/dehydratase [Candidatus Nitrosacidococcus sp. I8]CAH9017408.1 UDP-N-acetyl-alpha-D-glucosamine C6 dehydratase [Candidatus Nitrosacidococcus sp. I8]